MFIYTYLWSGQQLFRIYEIDIQLSRYVCQNTVQRVNVTSMWYQLQTSLYLLCASWYNMKNI